MLSPPVHCTSPEGSHELPQTPGAPRQRKSEGGSQRGREEEREEEREGEGEEGRGEERGREGEREEERREGGRKGYYTRRRPSLPYPLGRHK